MRSIGKIVITGMGAVSPIGIGIEPFWDNLIEGKCGIGRIRQFPVESDLYLCKIAAEVPEFVPRPADLSEYPCGKGRFAKFAMTSLDMAIMDAGLVGQEEILKSAALFIGSAAQTGDTIEDLFASWVKENHPPISPDMLSRIDPISVITAAAQIYGIRRKVMNLMDSCCTGVLALMLSADYLRAGMSEIGIVVGTDTISPLVFMGTALTGEFSKRNDDPTHAMRPFDRDQDGWVIGEGAVALVIETESHALARGAHVYAELGPFAPTTDGSSFKYIDETGSQMGRGMAMVLDQVPVAQIDYISAHGTAVAALDRAESAAIRRAFGKFAYQIPVTSIRGAVGSPASAGGLLQVVSAALSIRDGIIPHIINLENPLSGCDLDYVKTIPRLQKIRNVFMSAHGGGGLNIAFTVNGSF